MTLLFNDACMLNSDISYANCCVFVSDIYFKTIIVTVTLSVFATVVVINLSSLPISDARSNMDGVAGVKQNVPYCVV